MKGLAAGDLRDRVTIQAPNLVDNGKGGRRAPAGEAPWKDVATVWAEVLPLRGGEALVQSIQRSTQLWRVTIRIRPDVTTGHRLRWNGLVMNVRAAVPNETRDGLVMTAESGTATG